MTDQTYTPTSDEGLLAAIAHFFGLLVALIVWATQKDKSRYVRFQAMQALAFDLMVSVITLLVVGVMVLLVFGVLALGVVDLTFLGSQGNPTAESVRSVVALMTGVPFLLTCIFILVGGAIFVVRLIASIQTLQGKDFHYPWLGKWVEARLSN